MKRNHAVPSGNGVTDFDEVKANSEPFWPLATDPATTVASAG